MKYFYILLAFIIFLTGCVYKESENEDDYGMQGEKINIEIHKEMDNSMPDIMPEDFEIVFEYGVHQAKQHDSINTINNVITKDLIIDGLATAELHLEHDDLESIYNELLKINVIEYPSNFTPPYKDNPEPKMSVYCTPSMEYRLKIHYDEIEYKLYWHNDNCSEAEKAIILRESFNRIINIISNTEEYKNFPESNGGYE